jgi:hypothetical protein
MTSIADRRARLLFGTRTGARPERDIGAIAS